MKRKYYLKNKFRFSAFISIILVIAFTCIFTTKAYGYKETTYRTITIKSGDTLWSLADTYGSNDEDTRIFIYKLKKINNLSTNDIYAGDTLKVPVK